MAAYKVRCHDFNGTSYIQTDEFIIQTDDMITEVTTKFSDLLGCDKVDATPIDLVNGYEEKVVGDATVQ